MRSNSQRMPVPQTTSCSSIFVSCLTLAAVLLGHLHVAAQTAGDFVRVDRRDLQQVIDAAPANAIVQCDRNQQLTVSNTVTISKPLTLIGLNARLPEKLSGTALLVVAAKGVSITDFVLTGNADSVLQKDRAPLLVVHAGDFRIERGQFNNSSKDGIMIDGNGSKDGDIVGGVVRDIVGRGVIRDTVSISGGDSNRIRNVLVDNIRCYDSQLRGAVEVSDGTDNITVRKVYAEGSGYSLDVQDHNRPGQSNQNVLVEDIYAFRCKHALRTANSRKGHANLTVRAVTARECQQPVQISHTENVHVSNVRVLDHTSSKAPVYLQDCHCVSLRDVVVANAVGNFPVLLIENCNDTLVDGVHLRGATNHLASAVCFRLASKGTFSGLRISNVSARNATEAGIVLEATGKDKGTLTDYLITGNLAKVLDKIQGQRRILANNLP